MLLLTNQALMTLEWNWWKGMRCIIFSTYIYISVGFVLGVFCWCILSCLIFCCECTCACLSYKGWPGFIFFFKELSWAFIYSHWCLGTKNWSAPDEFPGHILTVLVPMPGHLPRFLAFSCCKIGVFNPWYVLILRSIVSFHVSYHHTLQAFTKVFSRWLSMQHNTPEQWHGLMENKGKSLRLCHISKPSESCRSGKQMLNSGKTFMPPIVKWKPGRKNEQIHYMFF